MDTSDFGAEDAAQPQADPSAKPAPNGHVAPPPSHAEPQHFEPPPAPIETHTHTHYHQAPETGTSPGEAITVAGAAAVGALIGGPVGAAVGAGVGALARGPIGRWIKSWGSK